MKIWGFLSITLAIVSVCLWYLYIKDIYDFLSYDWNYGIIGINVIAMFFSFLVKKRSLKVISFMINLVLFFFLGMGSIVLKLFGGVGY